MKNLKELVGTEIVALVPFFDRVKLQKLKLHAVEDYGIWVESQKFTNDFLVKVGLTATPRTLTFFLPWHQITLILGSADVPGLSETGLGL